MKYHKYQRMIAVAALVATPLLVPSSASAVNLPGTNCMPITMTQAPDIFFTMDGVTNKGTRALWVNCPFVWGAGDLIPPFNMAGFAPQLGISCIVRDVAGGHIWGSAAFEIGSPFPPFGVIGSVSNIPFALGWNLSTACKLPPGATLSGLFGG